jgi:hypothetical protein
MSDNNQCTAIMADDNQCRAMARFGDICGRHERVRIMALGKRKRQDDQSSKEDKRRAPVKLYLSSDSNYDTEEESEDKESEDKYSSEEEIASDLDGRMDIALYAAQFTTCVREIDAAQMIIHQAQVDINSIKEELDAKNKEQHERKHVQHERRNNFLRMVRDR